MTGPAVPGLTRHYCTLGDRQLHYRRCGSGPPLLALHRLPRSSLDLTRFIVAAAKFFTVIAPDIAGYGNSWHLSQEKIALDDYAADLEELLDALGVAQASLYGEGEGAALAILLEARNPNRFTSIAMYDLRISDSSDIQRARDMIPRFTPSWDGAHFAWLWAFLREENCFSPWWNASLATRLDTDMPAPDELQGRAVQFLADGRSAASVPGGWPRAAGPRLLPRDSCGLRL